MAGGAQELAGGAETITGVQARAISRCGEVGAGVES